MPRRKSDPVEDSNAAEQDSQPESPALEPIAALNDSILESIAHTRIALMEGLRTLQEETLEFIDQRLEYNRNIVQRCQECTNAMDLMTVHQEWITGTFNDYCQESIKLARVMHQPWSHPMRTLIAKRSHEERTAA
jgi:hypothetical protein